MFRESIRLMNERERAFLRECCEVKASVPLAGTLKWIGLQIGCVIGCGLMAWALIQLGVNPILGGLAGGLIASIGIVLLFAIISLTTGYLRWSRYDREFRQHDVPEILAALNDGMVSVKTVSASEVIEFAEFDDEGAGFLFDVDDGKILFLKGQRFFPVADDMEWPNSDFEIVRTAINDRWVGIFCSGRLLEPSRVIPLAECDDKIAWENDREELLEVNLNAFADTLRRGSD